MCIRDRSSGRRVSRMAGSARAHRPLYRDGERDHHRFGRAGDERESLAPLGG